MAHLGTSLTTNILACMERPKKVIMARADVRKFCIQPLELDMGQAELVQFSCVSPSIFETSEYGYHITSDSFSPGPILVQLFCFLIPKNPKTKFE